MTSGAENSSVKPAILPPLSGPVRFRYTPDEQPPTSQQLRWMRIWLGLGGAGLCFLFLYHSDLRQLAHIWMNDSAWSHGLVVPLISLFFVRLKWDTLRRLTPQGSLVGLLVLVLGVVGQVLFRATGVLHMSNLSILVVLLGVVLFVFGWEYLKVLWLPIGYLIFAIPPPKPLYVAMTTPMQIIAAKLGVVVLGLFGTSAEEHGSVIDVFNGTPDPLHFDVAEACSGMKMLVAFFALAVALAYSTPRPIWQKVFLALCALPIAIVCNGVRVALTGEMGLRLGQQWTEGKTHEYVGMLMLIPAMILQLSAAWILDRMFVEVPDEVGAAGGKP